MSGEGTIKFFNSKKGFGFIVRKDAPELFFHVSQWLGGSDPVQGELVIFEVAQGKKGIEARRVDRA